MHPLRKRKLKLILLSLGTLGLACGLIMYALRQNISLFYTPTQIVEGDAPINHPIHIGGMVVPHSIVRDPTSLKVQFKLTDYTHTVVVRYQGILPDLFREGQGVVTQGILHKNLHFQAQQVLAKHDENYMPPEVKASLKHANREKHAS